MPDPRRARYEFELSKAHRALWSASELADELNDPGAEEDLTQILREVTRLAQDSLRDRPRRRLRVIDDGGQ